MAGFEIVVRPVVFPDIRPRPTRSLPPQDDPTKGFAIIRGNGAQLISTSQSYSSSTSSSQRNEVQRRSDTARVFQKNDDGSVNKENFVDVNVANKIWMEGPAQRGGHSGVKGEGRKTKEGDSPTAGNIGRERSIQYYTPVEESKNVEIKKRNIITEGTKGGGG